MKRKVSRSFLFLAALLLVVSSCKKELLSELTLAGHEAIDAYQLATADLGIEHIVGATADSAASASSTLTFTSEGALYAAKGNALFSLSNQSSDYAFALSLADINTMTSQGYLQKNYSDTATFQLPQQALIKNVKFRAGQLRVKYSTNCKHNNSLTLTVPLLKQAGVAFSHQMDLAYTGTIPTQQEAVFDLNGYTLNLAFNGGLPSNRFYYTLQDSMTYIGNSLQIDDSTHLSLTFTGMEFSNIDGNFGQMVVTPMQSTFPLSLFGKVASGALSFKSPVLNLTLRNSMGMPMTYYWNQFLGTSPMHGTFELGGDTLARAWAYNVPTSKGRTASRTIKLNASSTNLTDFLMQSPTVISMSGRDTALQASATYTYFLTDSSTAGLDAQLQLPLEGKFDYLQLNDTLRLNAAAFKDQTIKSIRLYVENLFPLEANIQAWPLDAAGVRGVALLTGDGFTVASGVVKSTGAVSSPSIVAQNFELSSTQLDQLLHAGRLLIGVKMKSDAGTDVKLSASSKIKINIGVQAVR